MYTEQDIWIVLTGTGTWFSRMIQYFTKAPLNHASIAFDSELCEVYSFGRKKPTTRLTADWYGKTCVPLSSTIRNARFTAAVSVPKIMNECTIW